MSANMKFLSLLVLGSVLLAGCKEIRPSDERRIIFVLDYFYSRHESKLNINFSNHLVQQRLIEQYDSIRFTFRTLSCGPLTDSACLKAVLAYKRPDLVIIQPYLRVTPENMDAGKPTVHAYEHALSYFCRQLLQHHIPVSIVFPDELAGKKIREIAAPYQLAIRRAGLQLGIPVKEQGKQFYPAEVVKQIQEQVIANPPASKITAPSLPHSFSIPTIDISTDHKRQVVVDREEGQYLGHVTTVLLDDGRTMFAAYPMGHGKGAIVLKKSEDGGLTWSERLPVPENWSSSLEVPTLFKMTDKRNKQRLVLFSGLYPNRMACSNDMGLHWTPLQPIGNYGGIVSMSSMLRKSNGTYLAFFHDDGRYISDGGAYTGEFFIYSVRSDDGGLSWDYPEIAVYLKGAHVCEPGIIASPDRSWFAMLMRENSRKYNSFISFSNDEGTSWSPPNELPGSLTGDRHTLRYAPDGRIVAVFRDMCEQSPTHGDFVAWVGTWNDLVNRSEGQYRVRLLHNHQEADCGYAGLELLPDTTFVATTYGHWTNGKEPYILSVRFKLSELDRRQNHR